MTDKMLSALNDVADSLTGGLSRMIDEMDGGMARDVMGVAKTSLKGVRELPFDEQLPFLILAACGLILLESERENLEREAKYNEEERFAEYKRKEKARTFMGFDGGYQQARDQGVFLSSEDLDDEIREPLRWAPKAGKSVESTLLTSWDEEISGEGNE